MLGLANSVRGELFVTSKSLNWSLNIDNTFDKRKLFSLAVKSIL